MKITENVYYIGGSPCSGKSTVAEALSERYGLQYFKVDDHLDEYIKRAAEQGLPACKEVGGMSPDEIWMREPSIQCEEEFQIYREIFGYAMSDLSKLDAAGWVITEGAAFLPELMRSYGVAQNRYLSITPGREFQISHYKQREWIHFVLDGCTDPAKAFDNWMERDCLFAIEVDRSCKERGYRAIVNDGTMSVEELIGTVAEHFGLGR